MPNYPPNVPHFSGEVPTMMGVEGTLGTADTAGSANPLPIGVNPSTGAMYVQDLAGVGGTTNVQGSVTVIGGTLQAGTFTNLGTNVNVVSGTQQTLGTVGVLNNGTLAQVTAVSGLATGTLTTGS